MYLYDKTLYVACDKIYEYNLNKWPSTSEKVLKHPHIKIR